MVPATLPYSGGHLLVPAALLSCPQLGNSTVVVMLNNILLMFLGPCTYTEQYCLHISCLQLPSGPVSTVINTPQWNPGGATRGGAWALGSPHIILLFYCTVHTARRCGGLVVRVPALDRMSRVQNSARRRGLPTVWSEGRQITL